MAMYIKNHAGSALADRIWTIIMQTNFWNVRIQDLCRSVRKMTQLEYEVAFEGGTSPIPTSLLLCWIKAEGNQSTWSSWSMTSSRYITSANIWWVPHLGWRQQHGLLPQEVRESCGNHQVIEGIRTCHGAHTWKQSELPSVWLYLLVEGISNTFFAKKRITSLVEFRCKGLQRWRFYPGWKHRCQVMVKHGKTIILLP